MRLRPLPILATLIALAVMVSIFLFEKDSEQETAQTASSGVAARPDSGSDDQELTGSSQAVDLGGALAEADLPSAPSAPGAQIKTEEREAITPTAGQIVLEGRVSIPSGTPLDEDLRVVALQNEMSLQSLGGGAVFAAIWGDPSLLSSANNDSIEAPASNLPQTKIAEDGHFELVLPEGVRQAHLAVSGRYLYSERTLYFKSSQEDIVLTPRLGAWISGEIAAADDAAPLDTTGLTIGLFPDLSSGRFDPMGMRRAFTSARVAADASGHFAFRGVPVATQLGLVAKTSEHAMPFELGLALEPGKHLEVRLEAEDGASLSGRILNAQGEGVEGAGIGVTPPGILGQVLSEMRSTTSDADGSFTLKGLPSGELKISYRADGFLTSSQALEEPLEKGEVRTGLLLTLEEGATITGHVQFPGGQPAVAAKISFSRDASSMGGIPGMGAGAFQGGSAESDSKGDFRLSGLQGGPFLARASLEIEAGPRAGSWSARQPKIKLSTDSVELQLERAEELAVHVTDLQKDPIEDFQLTATLAGSSGMFGIGAEVRSNSIQGAVDGLGRIKGLTPGDWELSVNANGFADSATIEFSIPHDELPLEVVLYPTATVTGSVVDSQGESISGAKVSVALQMQEMLSGQKDPPSAISDEEGNFTLLGMNPGAVALVAEADGFAKSESVPLELVAGALQQDVVLVLPAGGTILGQVVDDEGNPRPDRMIVAQKPPDFTGQRMDRTDADGRFVMEHLEPGRWQVTAMKNMLGADDPGGTTEEGMASMLEGMEVDFVEVGEGEVVELVLGAQSEQAVSVKLHVLSDGEPTSGAMISFVPEGSEGGPGMDFKMTDNEGKATIALDKAGPYLVSVQQNMAMGRQSVVEYIEVIPEVEDYELEIELPVGTISGRVYAPNGDPLSGCRVTLTVEDGMNFGSFLGGNYAEVVTDEAGDYRLENLRPGTYSIAAGGSAMGGLFGGSAPGGRVVRGGFKVSEGQSIEGVDFHLETPGTITGIVRDQAGQPVKGAAVFVRDSSGLLLERFSFVATGDDGSFRYDGVQAGTYFVSARKTGVASHESASVRIDSGKEASVALRLEAGTMVLVRVIDRSGKDVQARVRVIDPNGHEVTGMLSMSDIMENFGAGFSSTVQRVGPLAPGSYRVEVTSADGRSSTKPVTLDGRAERKLTVRLR